MLPPLAKTLASRPVVLVGLFGFLLAAYTWNDAPMVGNDTVPARLVAVNLIKRGDLTLDHFEARIRAGLNFLPYYALPTKNGHIVSRFGVGAPIAASPFFAWALWRHQGKISDGHGRSVAKFAAATYVAGAAVGIAAIALQSGATLSASLLAALIYGLATVAFSISSQALWQHGPGNFFLAAAIASLMLSTRTGALLSGLSTAAMVACRPPTILLGLCLLAYLMFYERRLLLWWLLGALPITLLQSLYNALYFGAPWRFSQTLHSVSPDANYPPSYWQNPPLQGILGMLFSPARGLFIYSPIFLWLFWHPLRLWRQSSRHQRFLMVGTLATLLLLSRYWGWHGGWCFGYRMLADVTPVLTLALLPTLGLLEKNRSLQVLFALSLIVSIFIHALGAYSYEPFGWDAHPDVNYHRERLWDFEDTPIGYTLKHLHWRA
jgi:hypothetical protein